MDPIKEKVKSPLSLDGVDGVMVVPGHIEPAIRLLKQCKEYNISTAVVMTGDRANEPLPAEIKEAADRNYILNGEEKRKSKNHLRKVIRQLADDLGIPLRKTVLLSSDPSAFDQVSDLRLALRIGITNGEKEKGAHGTKEFYQNGANLVLESMEDVTFSGSDLPSPTFTQEIPNLFQCMNKFRLPFQSRKPVFFFDYDGTLTPIIKDPAKAFIPNATRTHLRQLAEKTTIAVVSGRDINDIREFIQLENIIYAGSHGFRISGPNGMHMENDQAKKLLPRLSELESILYHNLEKKIRGVAVERKQFAIAVHYRNAPPKTFKLVHKHVDELLSEEKDFKKGSGKKIVEIKPSLDWHKGKAVEWIMKNLGFEDPEEYIPVYVGDDVTDEDAFRTLADDGIGILVGAHSQPSAAHFQLSSVSEVTKFLHFLVHSAYS